MSCVEKLIFARMDSGLDGSNEGFRFQPSLQTFNHVPKGYIFFFKFLNSDEVIM